MPHRQGSVIRGYELRQKLGVGGSGVVYRAYQRIVDREVAVKIIHPDTANRSHFIRRFEVEAQTIARLEHLNIVPLYDYWRDPSGAYLVMRWLRGGSLRDVLRTDGVMSVERVGKVLDQICAALAVAHRQDVIHRDIKPENILLDEQGNAFLTDFGIAVDLRRKNMSEIYSDNYHFGSPGYVAPEVVMGKPLHTQTDTYSLGIVIFELLTGDLPYEAENVAEILQKHVTEIPKSVTEKNPDLPAWLDTVIWRATAKSPDARFANILQMSALYNENLRRYHAPPPAPRPVATTQPFGETGKLQLEPTPQMRPPPPPAEQPYGSTVSLEPAISEPIKNPYRGLRAFEEDDAANFYGRDRLIERLYGGLLRMRFLALVGASGSGKSSVINAGLLPLLRKQAWYVTKMVPGATPVEELEDALLRVAITSPTDLSNLLHNQTDGLHVAIQTILPSDTRQFVLVIDQFEELFTQVESEAKRAHFLDLLVYALNQPDTPLKVIVSIRADFYDGPLRYSAFGELMQQATMVVLPMNGPELSKAVREPAQQAGLVVDEGLDAAIIADVTAQPGALPLLQFALAELFERSDRKSLTLAGYQAVGGIGGALSRRATVLYRELDADTQEAARRVFLRLVTLDERRGATRQRVMRAQLLTGDDAPLVEAVLQRFGEHRLLTFDRDSVTRMPTVEIAHEAIIDSWKMFRDWVSESQDELVQRARLASAVKEWQNSARDNSFLVEGTRLAGFEALAESVKLDAEEVAFVAASVARREARVQRLRLFAAVMTGLLLVAVAAAVLAVVLQGRASRNAQTAQSRELAVMALFRRDEQPDLSLLLGVEAVAVANTTEARSSLYTVLNSFPYMQRYIAADEIATRAIAYSPDGRLLASGGRDRTVRLHDADTGDLVAGPLVGHTGWVNAVTFDSTGSVLATADAAGEIRLWDVQSGALRTSLVGHAGDVWSLVFLPDDAMLVSVGADNSLIAWDVASGEVASRADDAHDCDAFAADIGDTNECVEAVYAAVIAGDVLWTGGADGAVRRWALPELTPLGEPLLGHENWVMSLAADLTGTFVASSGADAHVVLWQGDQAVYRLQTGHANWIRGLTFMDDGSVFVTASNDAFVQVWDTATGARLTNRLSVHKDAISAVAARPGTREFTTGGTDVVQWDLARPQRTNETVVRSSSEVMGVAVSGDLVAYAGRDGSLQVVTAEEAIDFTGHNAAITDVAFVGETLVSVGVDRTLYAWDVTTGARVFDARGHNAAIQSVTGVPACNRIVTGADDNHIILWEAEGGTQLGEPVLAGQNGGVLALAAPSDRCEVVSGGRDGGLAWWDAETGELLHRTVARHTDRVTGVVYSSDDDVVYSVAMDGTLRWWDAATGEALGAVPIAEESLGLHTVDLNADGDMLAMGGRDGRVRLWDRATQTEIGDVPVGHGDWVNDVAFAGGVLYSVGRDGALLRWELRLERWVAEACAMANRGFTEAEAARWESSSHATCLS